MCFPGLVTAVIVINNKQLTSYLSDNMGAGETERQTLTRNSAMTQNHFLDLNKDDTNINKAFDATCRHRLDT